MTDQLTSACVTGDQPQEPPAAATDPALKTRTVITSKPASAETTVQFLCDGVVRVLTIETSKPHGGGLRSLASVHIVRKDGILTFEIHGDFMRTLIHANVRATEKAVREQHNKALSVLDALIPEVRSFYAKKAKAQASAIATS